MLIKKTSTIPINRNLTGFDEEPVANIASFSADAQPNIFSITHETSYQYTSTISFSKHLLRLQPVQDAEQSLLNFQLNISANCEVCNFIGTFGNYASFLIIKEAYSELKIVSQSVVAVSAFERGTALSHQPRTIPMIWMPWDHVMLQAYLQPPELPEAQLFELAEYALSFIKRNNNDVLEVIEDMNQTLYKEYAYVAGSTTLGTTAYEVYMNRKGVCQDFAHLLICLLRLLNVPARYRVGYIYTGGNYENTLQSDQSHAWVEAYIPYLGWMGFDPTNGCLAGKNHIKIACGRFYNDATPTSGTIFNAPVGTTESLSTTVEVVLLNK